MNKKLIIDFDSTFVTVEGLDELAGIYFHDKADKNELQEKIADITRQERKGKISFFESLSKRIKLIKADVDHLEKLGKTLKEKITSSVIKNKNFFIENSANIYIFSRGFQEFIMPALREFGISEENVFANTFVFDDECRIVGFNEDNFLAHTGGKVKQLKELDLGVNVWVIGDDLTDYQMKEAGLAEKFIAFTENVKRDQVVEKADFVAKDFSEIITELTKEKK